MWSLYSLVSQFYLNSRGPQPDCSATGCYLLDDLVLCISSLCFIECTFPVYYTGAFDLGQTCPLCPQLDSALHIFSGCQHTQLRNTTTERQHLACSMIFKASSKTGSLGSCFVCMVIGSSERLAVQNLPTQLKPGLYRSGSFHPTSQQ
jgi:hypothetical protein